MMRLNAKMTPARFKAFVRAVQTLFVITILTATFSSAAQEIPSTPLLFSAVENTGSTLAQTQPELGIGVVRARPVSLQLDALTGGSSVANAVPAEQLVLNFFNDATFTVTRTSLEPHQQLEGFVWKGRVEGDPLGQANLVVGSGSLSGFVMTDGYVYQINQKTDGSYTVEQIDLNLLNQTLPEPELLGTQGSTVAEQAVPEFIATPNSISELDLLVVYTPRARDAQGGTTQMINAIQSAVASVNTIYENSGIYGRLNLVYVSEVAYNEDLSNASNDLLNMQNGSIGEINDLREQYSADLVTMITDTYEYCGIGYVMTLFNSNQSSNGFNVVVRSCLAGGITMAHEIGHNLGAFHDRTNSSTTIAPMTSYVYGYQDPTGAFHDVMAYQNGCAARCPQIPYMSNTTVVTAQTNRPMGNMTSDVAKLLNASFPVATSFRQRQLGVLLNNTVQRAIVIDSLPVNLLNEQIRYSTANTGSCSTQGSEVWYRYNPTTAESINVSSEGSNYQVALAIYRAPEASPYQVSTRFCSGYFDNFVSFETIPGYVYYVVASRRPLSVAVYPVLHLHIWADGSTVPGFLAPSPGAPGDTVSTTLVSDTPTFGWSTVAGAVAYDLQYSYALEPVHIDVRVTSSPYTPSLPLQGGYYRWRVRAVDADGNVSGWSKLQTFMVNNNSTGDAHVILLYQTNQPVLTWLLEGRPYTHFELQIAQISTFSSILHTLTTTDGSTQSLQTPALADGTYYWRVRGVFANNSTTNWSSAQSFVVELP
jgi:peptidyl-Asp metalloendopeptidase